MNRRRSLLSLLLLALAPATVAASDLSKVDRMIAKEPAYQTKDVRYCLLVFGPDAKTRVWLVQDGETLYVDRNANGDLTEPGKRVSLKEKGDQYRWFEAGDIKDGPLTLTGLSVSQRRLTEKEVASAKEFARLTAGWAQAWTWTVQLSAERAADDTRPLPRKISYAANGDGLGYLVFADRPRDAPAIHINGPWTLGLQDFKQRLIVGRKSQLQIGVGTPGIGPGTFAYVMYPGTMPADVYPLADVAFPARAPGGTPTTKHYNLTDRCYYTRSLKLLDSATGREIRDIPIGDKLAQVFVIGLSPDGQTLVGDYFVYEAPRKWDNPQCSLKWWDVATGREVASFVGDKTEGLLNAQFSPDGRTLAATNSDGNDCKLRLFRVADRQLAKTIGLGTKTGDGKISVRERVFSPDGKWLTVITQRLPDNLSPYADPRDVPQPRIHLIDVAAGETRETLVAPPSFIMSASFSPDGGILATGGQGKVLLWDVSNVTARR
jgi:hypothetical protein